MIMLQFKADHPLWGFEHGAEYLSIKGRRRPKPLDAQRIQTFLDALAKAGGKSSLLVREAYALSLIQLELLDSDPTNISAMLRSKYSWEMLALLVQRGGVEPAEWQDLTYDEISSALRVQGALAERGRVG